MERNTTRRVTVGKMFALALMLAMILAAHASPALAQGESQYAGDEVAATGTLLEKAEATSYMYGSHVITDEATGVHYALESEDVDLDAWVDQRVTVHGTLIPGAEGPPLLDVYQVVPAGGPGYETVTATFELTVEGEPPAEDTVDGWSPFQGNVGPPSESYGMLLDQDGDGVYTAAWPVKKGVEAPVDISYINAGGELVRMIEDFGLVSFDEDKTFSASVSFDGPEPPATKEVSAMGTIERLDAEPVVVDEIQICELSTHAITDAATGQYYDLKSDTVNLEDYVGQRVTVTGTLLASPDIGGAGAERCPDLEVTRVEPADDGHARLNFELVVEGEPPADATFFARFIPPSRTRDYLGELRLTDPDGDGVYTYTEDAFYTGDQLGDVKIIQGTGTKALTGGLREGLTLPGEPIRVIKDFGTITLEEDTTLSASVSFEDTTDPVKPAPTIPTDNGGSGNDSGFENGDSASGGKTGLSVLPDTGGAFPALGALGAVLLAGGLLARRLGR